MNDSKSDFFRRAKEAQEAQESWSGEKSQKHNTHFGRAKYAGTVLLGVHGSVERAGVPTRYGQHIAVLLWRLLGQRQYNQLWYGKYAKQENVNGVERAIFGQSAVVRLLGQRVLMKRISKQNKTELNAFCTFLYVY